MALDSWFHLAVREPLHAVLPLTVAAWEPVLLWLEFNTWSLTPLPAAMAPVAALVDEPLTAELSAPLLLWLLPREPP